MLNRLFIVVGVLAILALSAAFVVPRFIQWGDYRERMEEAAATALGAPVKITGDIAFALLPQPELNFSDVVVGPPDKPVLRIAHVQAQFSLIDFIRDRYTVTKLVLDEPVFDMAIGTEGRFDLGLALTETMANSNVSIQNAMIAGGIIHLADARTESELALRDIAGDLRIDAVRGPFAFQGSGTYEGEWYDLRVSATAIDDGGKTGVSIFAQPVDTAWSLSAEGQMTLSDAPAFSGEAVYRQKPPASAEKDDVRGNLLLGTKLEASVSRVLLSAYTLTPDDNRAATRLTGAAEITLGDGLPKFNAVISGGVLALPPRDATTEDAVAPYELVRLLGELPVPPIPPIAGTVSIDIAELNLRAVSVRNVRLDASTDAIGWQIERFSGQLPGNTSIRIDGALQEADAQPLFSGTMTLETKRLDLLAQQWRRPAPNNPLFNMPASWKTAVLLQNDTLEFTEGALVIDGVEHVVSAKVGFGATRRIDLTAKLGAMSPADSAAVAALVPDFGADGRFGLTFPRGSANVTAVEAEVLGLHGEGLSFDGAWEGGVLEVKLISADDLGGASFAFTSTAFGTLLRPELSGQGTLQIADASAPILDVIFERAAIPPQIQDVVRRATPIDVAVALDPPGGDSSQSMMVKGKLGTITMTSQATLSAGLPRASGAAFDFRIDLAAESTEALANQFGLVALDVFPPDQPIQLALMVGGNPANSLATTIFAEAGSDSIGFSGNVVVYDPQWSGRGRLEATLSDPSGLTAAIGADGVPLPPLDGVAELSFTGTTSLQLSGIEATSGGQAVSGQLKLATTGSERELSGDLKVGSIPLAGLVTALVGPAAMIGDTGQVWPNGPIAIGNAARDLSGRVRITTPAITMGETALLSDARFDLDWDASRVRLRGLEAGIGGGTLSLDATICCAGMLPDKTFTGRIVVDGADLKTLLPAGAAAGLGGTVDLNAQVEGTGDSIASAIGTMSGEGSFTLDRLEVAGFDPAAFAAAGEVDNIVELEPDNFAKMIVAALERGPFVASGVSGHFIIAGGTVRSPNLAVETDTTRLQGGATVRLGDLSLDGTYTLTPKGNVGPSGLISEATSAVVAHVGGTLLQPRRSFDVAAMVDAVQVKAFEVELADLERLRAEDEARAKAAAEERARIAAERARNYALAAAAAIAGVPQVSEDLARIAAGDAARRAAEIQMERLLQPAVEPLGSIEEPVPFSDGALNLTPAEPSTQF